jgi:hypothetical protein
MRMFVRQKKSPSGKHDRVRKKLLLERYNFTQAWQIGRCVKAFSDLCRQCSACLVFAMRQNQSRLARGYGGEPSEQVFLSCVCAESTHGVDLGTHDNSFTVNANHLLAFDKAPSQ